MKIPSSGFNRSAESTKLNLSQKAEAEGLQSFIRAASDSGDSALNWGRCPLSIIMFLFYIRRIKCISMGDVDVSGTRDHIRTFRVPLRGRKSQCTIQNWGYYGGARFRACILCRSARRPTISLTR